MDLLLQLGKAQYNRATSKLEGVRLPAGVAAGKAITEVSVSLRKQKYGERASKRARKRVSTNISFILGARRVRKDSAEDILSRWQRRL